VHGPDPQGFSGFTPSSPSAKAGNKLQLKWLTKVELPSLSLHL